MDFKLLYKEYIERTHVFFKNRNIKQIKETSQYFTPLKEVDKMIENLKINKTKIVNILDPSCGSGILTIKIIEKILSQYTPDKIIVDAIDSDYQVLQTFIELTKYFNKKVIEINFLNDDFIKLNINKKYNYIIMNPPYKKINVINVPTYLSKYLNGQPNIYHLFIAKSLGLLDKNGILCLISPKNYLSGRYTEKIRTEIIRDFSITNIHTFDDRRNVFEKDIIQEICIVHIENLKNSKVYISHNGHIGFETNLLNVLVNNKTNIIQTPRSNDDLLLLEKFKKFPIGTIGKSILMKTGKVVQFRVKNNESSLKEEEYNKYKNGVPLIVYRHINTGILKYEVLKNKLKNRAITLIDSNFNKSLLIENKNYLIMRKNTDKKYKKLIHSIVYLQDINSKTLAIDNGLAYLTNSDNSLNKEEILGLQCIMMSKQFDDYYRIVNSSHTINVYELENMHFPDINTIREIGKRVNSKVLNIEECTRILNDFI